MTSQHIVRMGRTDGTALKTLFFYTKKEALKVANSISFLLFHRHDFKGEECREAVLVEQGDFFLEFIPKHRSDSFSHGDV